MQQGQARAEKNGLAAWGMDFDTGMEGNKENDRNAPAGFGDVLKVTSASSAPLAAASDGSWSSHWYMSNQSDLRSNRTTSTG